MNNSKTLTWHNITNTGFQANPHLMWDEIRSLQGRKKYNTIHLSINSTLNTDPSSVAHHLGKYFEITFINKMTVKTS